MTLLDEQRRWDRYKMQFGEMYEYVDIDERPVYTSDQVTRYVAGDIEVYNEAKEILQEEDVVVLLDKQIQQVRTTYVVSEYQIFIKVLTKNGFVGWVSWFPEEWLVGKNINE